MALWSQTRKQRSTSRSLALIYGYIWCKIHRQCHRREDFAVCLVIVIRGHQEKLPRLSNGKKVVECSIETVVPVVAATKHKAVPSIEFSSTKGNFGARKRSGRDHVGSVQAIHRGIGSVRCIFHNSKGWWWPKACCSRKKLLDHKVPSVAADAGGENDTKRKEGIIGSKTKRKPQCVR